MYLSVKFKKRIGYSIRFLVMIFAIAHCRVLMEEEFDSLLLLKR